jgi:predicted HTH transcriptional regulator
MLSRNSLLHYVFAQMEMAEEQGLGIRSMRTKAANLGLPLPTYTWNPPYLTLTLYRTPDAATGVLTTAVREALSDSELLGWQWLSTIRSATAAEYARALAVEQRTARRHMSHFEKLGLIGKQGSGPATRYVLR